MGADTKEESDVESLGRAIITTPHLQPRRSTSWTLENTLDITMEIYSPRSRVDAKFGGIRVLIEQMVEVEYESDLQDM